jgi:competence protein ComGC
MRSLFAKLSFFSTHLAVSKRYWAYAAGEILLIVVSLLLALQINQLNKQREDELLRTGYYQSLVNDFKSDLKKIEQAKNAFKNELDKIDAYGRRLSSPQANDETLVQITRDEFNPNIPPFVSYTQTTLDTMRERGHLGMLDTAVLKQLNEIAALKDEHFTYRRVTLESHSRLLERYLSNYPIRISVVDKGPLFDKSWENVNVPNLFADFNGLLTISRAAVMNAIFYYEKIEVKTAESIKVIEATNTH